jgi:hypothetical protein
LGPCLAGGNAAVLAIFAGATLSEGITSTRLPLCANRTRLRRHAAFGGWFITTNLALNGRHIDQHFGHRFVFWRCFFGRDIPGDNIIQRLSLGGRSIGRSRFSHRFFKATFAIETLSSVGTMRILDTRDT